jgi:hypothetical protein
MTVTLIHYLAAALVIIGSALVLRAVWLVDLEAESQTPQPRAAEAAPAEEEWREAA